MLVRWLYGQQLCGDNDDPDSDLFHLVELYRLACDAGTEKGARIKELVDPCLDAIRKCLVQKSETLDNPIDTLEHVLLADDSQPGRAAILKELIYGECATDERTRAWLEEYCGSEEHKTDVV